MILEYLFFRIHCWVDSSKEQKISIFFKGTIGMPILHKFIWFFRVLLVHIFLPNFFLPVNFACNMLWYSTPWTATPFSNDPLWLTLFVEGVNDRLLDHCQVSSVPHYCLLHHILCTCVDQLWIKVQIKSEFMNDVLTCRSLNSQYEQATA